MEKGRFDGLSLDSTHSEKLIKLMDWFVVRLEDGTDEDAAKLLSDEPPKPKVVVKSPEKADNGVVPKKEGKENGGGEKQDTE
jgi:hypothetical protein